MSLDVVFGTASSFLTPFAQLLSNETVIGIICLLYVLVKFEAWLQRKSALGLYEQELLLERDKIDLRKKIMKGDWKDTVDFDKVVKRLASRYDGHIDDIVKLLGDTFDIDLEKWK